MSTLDVPTSSVSASSENAEAGSGIAVLDRAFALLEAFGPADERLTLTELSRRTGLYKSTVLRILGALEHGGFIRRLDDRQYAIGPQPMRLAAIYQRSFRVDSVLEPLLFELSRTLGETTSFYVRTGEHRLVVSRVEPARSVRVSIRIGEEFPVDRGASGKVLLAFTEGPEGAGDPAVRDRLWATSYGERDPETASASVPVFGAVGEFKGALTVSGPIARLGELNAMHGAIAALLDVAGRATAEFGGNRHRYASCIERLSPEDVAAAR